MVKKKLVKKRFEELSKAEQRVVIAKDVIKQVNVGKYTAHQGCYIGDINGFSRSNYKLKGDIKSQFSKIENCEVCALGGILMSAVKFKNTLTFQDLAANRDGGDPMLSSGNAKKIFSSLFTPKQLLMIESAFESYSEDSERVAKNAFGYEILSEDEQIDISNFYKSYESEEERLIGICQNIIKNGGTFVL